MKKLIPLLLLIIFSCNKNSNTIDRKDYDKAYEFLSTSQKDSAFKYFNKAKDNFVKQEKLSYAGSCLVNMAIIQNDAGDYYGSQETGLSAIKYLNEKEDSSELSSNYNSLGIAFQNLGEYNKATQFYHSAARFSKSSLDSLTHINNRAVAFAYSKKFDSAICLFNDILAYPNLKEHLILYSKVIDNQAYFTFLKNKDYNVEKQLMEALKIRNSINDNWGLIATYSHLTEYFENKDPEKALFYANKMLHVSSINKSPDDRLSALKKIAFLENSENTKTYFKRHQSLNDSLQIIRNKSKSQFAFERYDSEKFKRENLEKNNSILKLSIGIAALILTIIFIIFLYRKRQLRLKQEKELEVKNTELKYSKKVHDVVANGLYHMMIDVQNNPEMNKVRILNDIEKMYEESRDIATENIVETNFSSRFGNMISSYSSPDQKVFVVGYTENIWENISHNIQLELYYILRELLVNMKKHSQAKLASLKFEKEKNILKIKYTDNGIGTKNLKNQKGTGIQNMENRIETIGANITFENKTNGGLVIQIMVPINLKYV